MQLKQLPDKTVVYLADNITSKVISDDEMEYTEYMYDEAVFDLPEDRHETVETILEAFEAWWCYAEEDHSEPTLEDRVTLIEEYIFDIGE